MQERTSVMRGTALTAALCLASVALMGASGAPYARHGDNVGAIIQDIGSTLYHTPVRLYYSDVCSGSKNDPLNNYTSNYDIRTPQSERRGMGAMRTMLETNARDAIVSKGPHGIVQVRVGAVLTSIVRARISVLQLTSLEQYNPNLAILAMQRTPEFTSAMRQSGLDFPPLDLMDMIVQQPRQGLPHLPSLITNATVDEVLDSIASTFSGIALYQVCRQPRGGRGYLTLSFIGLD